ncbi:hypothetical protein XENTR_v10014102 [Xenopus tropicalis]|nr:hypothetical protein XENTR_v10014102 [Xenopus tropicalis]
MTHISTNWTTRLLKFLTDLFLKMHVLSFAIYSSHMKQMILYMYDCTMTQSPQKGETKSEEEPWKPSCKLHCSVAESCCTWENIHQIYNMQ